MYITIISVGKLKEEYWKILYEEYLKRINPYAKITVKEVIGVPFRNGDNLEKIKEIELTAIEKQIEKDSFVIFLKENGKEYSSVEFSKFLEKKTSTGQHITFVIAGALGFAEKHIDLENSSLSLSKMTFPHKMARIVLLEQIYRAITIKTGKKYHY
ncbi:MAG: 23S rRNA (pseudouridine(1915)-N(3))-methyltransferase RlmH [Candidatus Magasanikbacteria bacterium]|nr:23S rRNA (pseudouridine(1915)-N(3))-methyltransferase RlmH [Candidatus Magasanikbacteria bacterium]